MRLGFRTNEGTGRRGDWIKNSSSWTLLTACLHWRFGLEIVIVTRWVCGSMIILERVHL